MLASSTYITYIKNKATNILNNVDGFLISNIGLFNGFYCSNANIACNHAFVLAKLLNLFPIGTSNYKYNHK